MLKACSEIGLSKFTDNFGSSISFPFNTTSIKLGLGGHLHRRRNKQIYLKWEQKQCTGVAQWVTWWIAAFQFPLQELTFLRAPIWSSAEYWHQTAGSCCRIWISLDRIPSALYFFKTSSHTVKLHNNRNFISVSQYFAILPHFQPHKHSPYPNALISYSILTYSFHVDGTITLKGVLKRLGGRGLGWSASG
jgi:hypothetical protein